MLENVTLCINISISVNMKKYRDAIHSGSFLLCEKTIHPHIDTI